MSENRSAKARLGCLILAILCAASGLVVAVIYLRAPTDSPSARAASTSSASSTVQPTTTSPRPPFTEHPSAQPRASQPALVLPPGMLREPIRLDDLAHVDPQQLFAPAKQLAHKLEPLAELGAGFPVTTHGGVISGAIDLSGHSPSSGRVHFDYEYRYRNPGQPPGAEPTQGSVVVIAQKGHLTATRELRKVTHPSGHEVIPDPTCSLTRAWQTAVTSGVPTEAVAQVMYYDNEPYRKGGPYVWSFRVRGQDQYRREIDGLTCALVRSWAQQR